MDFVVAGGLRFSNLIAHHLIDHFVPFLPLEREHVKLCIRDYFRWKNITDPTTEQVTAIADMLQYFPKRTEVYAIAGCKRIEQKVELFLEEQQEKETEERRKNEL